MNFQDARVDVAACPFCAAAGAEEIRELAGRLPGEVAVVCGECGGAGPSRVRSRFESTNHFLMRVVSAWNRRQLRASEDPAPDLAGSLQPAAPPAPIPDRVRGAPLSGAGSSPARSEACGEKKKGCAAPTAEGAASDKPAEPSTLPDPIVALQAVIDSLGVSLESVARDLGVSAGTLGGWLRGQRVPREASLKKIRRFVKRRDAGARSVADLEPMSRHAAMALLQREVAAWIRSEGLSMKQLHAVAERLGVALVEVHDILQMRRLVRPAVITAVCRAVSALADRESVLLASCSAEARRAAA